jgi:arabinogalactan oligomer / maltooligosaccharide transport system permease protein
VAGDAVSGLARLLAAQVSEGTPLTLQRGADTGALAVTLGLAGLAATGLCWAFTSGAMNRLWETIKTHRTAYAYIAPAIILLILLSFFPFFYGIAMSFTNTSLLNASEPFVDRLNGLDNYAAILGDFNLRQPDTGVLNYQNFYWTAFMTVIWTVTNVFLGVSIGLGLALLLNIKGLQGVAIYRTLLILPWALPNYITALTWKGLFHPQFGAFNSVIQAFGGDPVKWFDTLWPAFFTGLATNAWLSFPFMMVVALGALQSIDQGMYEAAKIDGASPWQRFTMITLPSLKPALLPAIIVSVVWTFNMFNVIFLVSAGQPSGGTEILITRAYKVAFEEYRYGYAAAYSVVIFLILLMYGVFQVRATKATEANA